VFSIKPSISKNETDPPFHNMSMSTLSPKSSIESLQSNWSTFSSPDKLAPAVAGPMVWEGNELDPAKYVITLSHREIQDIRAAVIKIKSK